MTETDADNFRHRPFLDAARQGGKLQVLELHTKTNDWEVVTDYSMYF